MGKIEEELEKLPYSIQKKIEVKCWCCGEIKTKMVEYYLKIVPLVIDGKLRYKVFYLSDDMYLKTSKRIIGEQTGIGFATLLEAIEDVKGYINE